MKSEDADIKKAAAAEKAEQAKRKAERERVEELAAIVLACWEDPEDERSEPGWSFPVVSDPALQRASELLRKLTNSSSGYTVPEVTDILREAAGELDFEIHALPEPPLDEESFLPFYKKTFLRNWFSERGNARVFTFVEPLMMDPSIYDAVPFWGYTPWPARDWAAAFGTMRVSEQPSQDVLSSVVSKTPVLWLSAKVRANFLLESEREFDRLHEQWIGALLVFNLAQAEPPDPDVERTLTPWPGDTGVGNVRNDFLPGRSLLPFRIKQRVLSVAHRKPADLNDLERHALVENDRFAGRSKELRRAFGAESEDTIRIRAAFRNFARASLEPEPGEAFLRLAMCLEGVLVAEKGDTTARISEAAAHYLGGPHSKRGRTRTLVNELYGARSKYVHAGRLEADHEHERLLEDSFSLVRAILRREIRELPDPPPLTVEGDGAG